MWVYSNPRMVNLLPVTAALKQLSIFPAAYIGLVVEGFTHVYALWVAFAWKPTCACKSFQGWAWESDVSFGEL